MRKGASVYSMKYNIIVILLLITALLAIGYGLGYVGDTVYNIGASDSITVER